MLRLTALFIALASPALAQESVSAAAAAARDTLETAAAQLAQAQSGRDQVRALTATVKAYEDGLIAMRDGLRRAVIRENAITMELNAKSAEIGQLLGVLQATAKTSGPLSLLHPSGALGTARAGMIAADLTPALQAEADALRGQLEEVALLRALQDDAITTLAEGLEGAQTARAQLSEAMSERTDLPRRFENDPIQTALLMASAETLDSFAQTLATAFADLPGATDGLAEKGNLALPVTGEVLRGYNTADAAGVVRPGIIIASQPRALVITPVAATVLFVGPLLDYDNVVVLEPAPDVLIVLAGLGEVYGIIGQVLPAGTPIGLMGGQAPDSNAVLIENVDANPVAATQTLYLEVREGQSPVDPAAWFVVD